MGEEENKIIDRVWLVILNFYLTDLACHPSHAFGGGFVGHLTNLAPGFWVLSHGFGMPMHIS